MPKKSITFDKMFKDLTGNDPLSWQRRLYQEWIADDVKSVIDLPTGLGKTMVIPIWLIAQAENPKLGRRLIYVVDRRTVVDQATKTADDIIKKLDADSSTLKQIPSISTLRGQHADKREWTRDPSHPAIIIGTVDMIGSRLLFNGYRSSYKQRPLDAGLLGQDSLLILDEAHLSEPFAKLTRSIKELTQNSALPFRIVHMSATTTGNDSNRFKLEKSDLQGDRDTNPIVRRFEAAKRLTIESIGDKKAAIVAAASNLAKDNSRVVVFVRSPDDATRIADAIRKENIFFTNAVEVLTGTMRGQERDELLEKPVMKRFLNGSEKFENRPRSPAILVSTSAGEVGFDLNADHLVCDAAPLDSMIQRLGRVNRRGDGVEKTAAEVRAFLDNAVIDPKKAKPIDVATAHSMKLLANQSDVSPKAIAELKAKLTPDQIKEASSPNPAIVELTDILLDAWSMTSIIQPMPGRPEVAPWLRGISEDLPQTTIAWRAELDLPGFDQLDIETIEEWFDSHRIQTNETLTIPTGVAAKWFIERWEKFPRNMRETLETRKIVADRAGISLLTIRDVINELSRKPANTDSIRNAELILPASFGGIKRGVGLLNESEPSIPKEEEKKTSEERRAANAARQIAPDIADLHGRHRYTSTKSGESKNDIPVEKSVTGELLTVAERTKYARFVVELESDDDRNVRLVSLVPKNEKPEWGSERQTLTKHVGLVQKWANEIIGRLELSLDDPFRQALELAAEWHDHGKNRDCWQRLIKGKVTDPGQAWSDETMGKSGGLMLRDSRGYRHEFGSLREFTDAHAAGKLIDHNGTKITDEVFDLAMHLIATHHGRGRPHFPKGSFDPDAELRSPEIHTDAIRRFARLQHNYGHWQLAWLENLLRCADAMASDEKTQGGVK